MRGRRRASTLPGQSVDTHLARALEAMSALELRAFVRAALDAVALMAKVMKERGITHTTSECTLRGFTCAQARVDPKVASPTEIKRARTVAIGHQIQGLTGGLEAE